MKKAQKKWKATNHEEIIEQVQKILAERGSKPLEMARNEILQEKIECKEVREALKYFMTQYWQDLARPALLSLACEAVGGDPEITIPIAVPMILMSGGMDIHDDIIDQSKIKRSRPTVLGKFGKDIALLVGDALLFKGLTLLCEAVEKGVPPEKTSVIIGIIKEMFFELGDAEASELRFQGRMDVTPEEYLDVVRKKAADVEAHTRISAILGGGSEQEIEALGRYGRILGMISILTDDLMDMVDFEEAVHRFKKESLPLPLLYALENSEEKAKISAILLKEKITERDAETILEITDEGDGLKRFEKLIKVMRDKAFSDLPDFTNKRVLELLIESLIPFLAESEASTRI